MPSALPFNGNQPILVDRSTHFPLSVSFPPNPRFSLLHRPPTSSTCIPFDSPPVFKVYIQTSLRAINFQIHSALHTSPLHDRQLIVISWARNLFTYRGRGDGSKEASNLICPATIFSYSVSRPRDHCIRRGLLIPRDGERFTILYLWIWSKRRACFSLVILITPMYLFQAKKKGKKNSFLS